MNENEYRVDGKRYVARTQTGCTGCAGQDKYELCVMRKCAGLDRMDERSIVWVEAGAEVKQEAQAGEAIQGRAGQCSEMAAWLSLNGMPNAANDMRDLAAILRRKADKARELGAGSE